MRHRFGVVRLAKGSTSWTRAGTGMPNVAVYGLTLAQDAHVLYAATHGRGAWLLRLAAPSSPAAGN